MFNPSLRDNNAFGSSPQNNPFNNFSSAKEEQSSILFNLKPLEKKEHDNALSAIGALGKNALNQQASQASQAKSTYFLKLHKTVKRIEDNSNISPSSLGSLVKIEQLAHQFELLALESEKTGITPEMVGQVHDIFEALKKSQQEWTDSTSTNTWLSEKDFKEISEELNETVLKVGLAVDWMHVKDELKSIDLFSSRALFRLSHYARFEFKNGLISNPSRMLYEYRKLAPMLQNLIALYNTDYLKVKDNTRTDLNLAKAQAFVKSMRGMFPAIIDHYHGLEDLILESANRKWDNASDENVYLETLKNLISEDLGLFETLNEELSAYSPVQNRTLKGTLADAVTHPEHWVTGLFHNLTHPIETAKKVFEAIEELSPLPTYTERSLIKENEALISDEIDKVKQFIPSQQLVFQQALESIENRLDELQKEVVTSSPTEQNYLPYQDWLDKFSDACLSWDGARNSLEAIKNPTEDDIQLAERLHDDLLRQKQSFIGIEQELDSRGFSSSVKKELLAEMDAYLEDSNAVINLLIFRSEFNTIENELNNSFAALMGQSEKLGTGEPQFSVDHDLNCTQDFINLAQLYEETHLHSWSTSNQKEILSNIQSEVDSFNFSRSEYTREYREALDAEVAKATLAKDETDIAEFGALEMQLIVAENQMLHMQSKLESALAPLLFNISALKGERADLTRAFQKTLQDFNSDIEFIQQQRKALETVLKSKAIQSEGIHSGINRTIASAKVWWHARNVDRNVQILFPPKDEKEPWIVEYRGRPIDVSFLRSIPGALGKGWIYSLYYHDRISSLAAFSQQAFRQDAELSSKSEYVRQAEKMPEERQAKASVEMNLMEGILKGFITYSPELAREHPDMAAYLKNEFQILPPAETPRISSGQGVYEQVTSQGGPDTRNLTSAEWSKHKVLFLGQQVQSYFKENGLELEQPPVFSEANWQPAFEHTPDSTAVEAREAKVDTPLEAISKGFAAAIKENQSGTGIDDNQSLEQLQKGVEVLFGTKLPGEWVEGWIFKQDWTKERLDHFTEWMAKSLGAQAWHHMAQPTPESSPSTGTMEGNLPLFYLAAGQKEPEGVGQGHHVSLKMQSTGEDTKIAALKTDNIAVQELLPAQKVPSPRASNFVQSAGQQEPSHPVSPSSVLSAPEFATLAGQSLEVKRLHVFLTQNPMYITPKMYAHTIGHASPSIKDAKLAEKDLEGSDSYDTLQFQLGIANSMFQAYSYIPSTNEKVGAEVHDSQALLGYLIGQLSIAQKVNSSPDFSAFHSQIRGLTNRLQPDESFFFPGGWIRGGTGHAIAWEVTRQKDGRLTIRLYNTGSGLEYHSQATIGLNEKYLQFTEIVDVDPNVFTSSALLQGIWDVKAAPVPSGKMKDWGASDIYDGLLLGLDGKLSRKQYSQTEMKLPQFVGICAMESVMAAVESMFPDEESANRYRFWGTLKATSSFFDRMQGSLGNGWSGEEVRRLIGDGVKALAARTHTSAQDGILTDAELAYVDKLLDKITAALAVAEKKAAASMKSSEPAVTFAVPPQDLQGQRVKLYVNEGKVAEAASSEVRSYVPIEWNEWQPNPLTLQKDLAQCLQDVHRGNHETHNYLEVQRAVRNVVLKIPLTDDAFWSQIDDREAEKLLSTFSEISKEFLWSFIHNDEVPDDEHNKLSSEDFLVQAKLLTLADKIAHGYANSMGLAVPSLFQASMRSFIFPLDRQNEYIQNWIPVDIRANGEWKEELENLKTYWISQGDAIDNMWNYGLFPFQAYPAGKKDGNQRTAYIDHEAWTYSKSMDSNGNILLRHLQNDTNDDYYTEMRKRRDIPMLAEWASENPEKVNEIDPELAKHPPKKQAALLYENLDKIPLFENLFTLSYVYDFFFSGSFFKPDQQPYDFSKGIKVDMHKKTGRFQQKREGIYEMIDDVEYWEMDYSLFGRKPHLSQNDLKWQNELMSGKRLQEGQTTDLGKTLGYFFSEKDLNHDIRSFRRRDDPNSLILLDPQTNEDDWVEHLSYKNLGVSTEQFRELLTLSSVRDLQISQTLGYFTANKQLLLKPEYQLFFRLLVMEESFLEKWLIQSPSAGRQLELFFTSALKAVREIGDVNAEIFLAGMSRRVEDVYRRERLQQPELFQSRPEPQFLPYREILEDFVRSPDLTDQQRALAYREIGLSFSNSKGLTADEAGRLLQAVMYCKLLRVPEEYRKDKDSERELNNLVRNRFSKEFHTLLEGPERDKFLSTAQRGIFNRAKEGAWTSPNGFPNYISPDGEVAINVLDGKLEALGKSPMPFDISILKDGRILEVFSKNPPRMMTILNDQLVEFNDSRGIAFRLLGGFRHWHEIQSLQRKFEGRWYEYKFQYEYAGLDSIFKNKAIVQGMQMWASKDPENKKAEVLLIEASSGKPKYRASMTGNEAPEGEEPLWSVAKLERLDEKEKGTGLNLVDASRREMYSFQRFENPEYIVGWARDGLLEEVSLPRFGLSFKVGDEDGKKVALCEQFPGYRLVEGDRQHFPELGDVGYYLHLKRKESDGSEKELIIFPRQKLAEYSQGSYLTETLPNRNLQIADAGSQRYFTYSPKGDRLVPTSSDESEVIEANLYLAMVHLSEKYHVSPESSDDSKYTKASKYLARIDEQMLQQREGLSQESKEILGWIASLNKATHDSHPDAGALQLKAHFLLARNRLDFPDHAEIPNIPEFKELYSSYLTHLNMVDKAMRLTPAEERLVIKILNANGYTPKFMTRLEQLTKDEGHDLRQLVIDYGSRSVEVLSLNRNVPVITGFEDWRDDFISPEQQDVQNIILLRNIDATGNFNKYYQVAKGEATVDESIAILNAGMGLQLGQPITKEGILDEMKIALKNHMGALSSQGKTNWRVPFLLAVLQEPHLFLPAEQFGKSLENLKAAKKDKDELPDSIKAWQGGLTHLKKQLESHQYYKQRTMDAQWFKDSSDEIQQKELKGFDDPIAKTNEDLKEQQATIDEKQKRLDDAKSTFDHESKVVDEGLFAPFNEMNNQGRLVLQIPVEAYAKESERLKQEKIKGQSMPAQSPPDLTFAKSIELRAAPYTTPHELISPVIQQEALDQIFEMRASGASSQPLRKPPFQVHKSNSPVEEKFKAAFESLDQYQKSGKGIPKEYNILDRAKVDELSAGLAKSIEAGQEALLDTLDALLKLANKEYEDPGLASQRHLGQKMGTEKLLSVDEVVRSLYLRDFEFLHNRNPALTEADIFEIFSLLQNYLLDATHLQQQKAVLDTSGKLSAAIKEGAADTELQEYIRQLVSAASAKREYDFHDHPEYLVFEYYAKFLIWKEQVDTLGNLKATDRMGALIELAMGMGKTHVIAVLQAWLNADGERLAILVMPEELIDSVAKDMQEKYGLVFGQRIRMLSIKRGPITVAKLRRIYEVLCEIRDERQVLMWTAGDVQSLFNQWVELNELAYEMQVEGRLTPDEAQDFSLKHQEFLKIFHLLIESGVMTVDEIHKVFDILTSHNFTFGRPKAVHADTSAASNHLFEAIASDPALNNLVRWEFLPSSAGEPFTEETYHAKVKGPLIESIVERGLDPDDEAFQKFFKGLSQGDKLLIKKYLADNPDDPATLEGYLFVSGLTGELGQRIKNELAVLKTTIGTVLPLTASKKAMVHFGADSAGEITIPYHDGEPTKNSLFGSVLERMLYTTQYYLVKGVPEEIVAKEIDSLIDQFKQDKSANRKPDLTRFHFLCGGSKEFSILRLKKNNYRKITEIVNRNPKVQLELIRKYRYPNIKVFPKEIQSSAHIFPLVSKEEHGVSGTLPNTPTFPNVFKPLQLSDTQDKTLDILGRRSPEKVATIKKGENTPPGKIASIYQVVAGKKGSIIDANGHLSGLDNEKLARAMLAELKSEGKEGVVYYDGNILKVVMANEDKPILYHRGLNKEKLSALWDLSHTTGSDIPLGPSETATLIVGRHTTLVSLMQAAWRLRGLAKGQTINFAVPEEDRRVMRQMLIEHLGEDIPKDADLTLDQIFSYTFLMQSLQESQNNYRAIKEKMKMVLAKEVIKVMWDPETPTENSFKIYEDARSLFVIETPDNPWEEFGAIVQEKPTPEALKELLENWKHNALVGKIRENPDLYKGIDLEGIFNEWDDIVGKVTGELPSKISSAATFDKTVEQQTNQQTNQQTEQQTKQQTRQQASTRTNLSWEDGRMDPRKRVVSNLAIFTHQDSMPSGLELVKATSEDDLKTDFFKKSGTGPCITANDMLTSNEALGDYIGVFDENLLVSLNFAPVQGLSENKVDDQEKGTRRYRRLRNEPAERQRPYHAFDDMQKDCTFVQIIQPEGNGPIKVKMLDPDDADEVRKQIEADGKAGRGGSAEGHEVRVGLYQLQKEELQIDFTGSNPIDLSLGDSRSEFLRLLVQAKFASGKLQYTEEEVPFLKEWIEQVGTEKAFGLLKKVLNPVTKSDSRTAFPTSVLAACFRGLGISKQSLEML